MHISCHFVVLSLLDFMAHQDWVLVYTVSERTSISFYLNNFCLLDKGIKHTGFQTVRHERCDIAR